MNRRAFVRSASAVAGSLLVGPPASSALLPTWHPSSGNVDLLLRGAVIYEGAGGPPFEGDVAVTGDRISDVGRQLAAPDAVEIDLRGLALAPGFIDIHSHSDLELLVNPRAESKIRQGVTTEIAGQDGSSIGPWNADRAASMRESYRSRYGVEIQFSDPPGFLRSLERQGMAVNLASMIGHGTVRGYVVGGDDRPATDAELKRMKSLVAAALRDGVCGLSSGLEYTPGAFADLDELVALAAPLRETGLPYATHMRNEDDHLLSAIEEALNVGRRAQVPVHISHLKAEGTRNWWKTDPVLETLEAARGSGLQVSYDRYPYVAYGTGLGSLFPVWARGGGTDALLARLNDSTLASRIEAAVRDKIARLGSWDAVQITSTGSDKLAWARGRRLGQLAAERGMEAYALLLQLTIDDRNRADMVGFGMSEENTARFLGHPLAMVCSDGAALATEGPLASGTPHPRNFGTYPRVLGHYCRDENLMPLETAIHKMTGAPAALLRLTGRGMIVAGAFADLVAFEPDRVADRATFDEPQQYPDGIPHVVVNGTFVIRDGEHTGALPGRVLAPES